jgi:hypothetical protein
LRPKKERDIFSMDKFKATFEKKENGWIKEEKPSTLALRSDRRGGKFIVTIFSWGMNVFKVFQIGKIVFQGCIDSHISLFQLFKYIHLQLKPTQPKRKVSFPFSILISISILTLERTYCFLDNERFLGWNAHAIAMNFKRGWVTLLFRNFDCLLDHKCFLEH